MASDNLQREFDLWLDSALKDAPNSSARAFCFNLTEPWGIEVIGARAYDESDSDWACDEVFRPRKNDFWLPVEEVGNDWELVLEFAKGLIARYLTSDCAGAAFLKSSAAVAIGFVDGELHVIHKS